MTNNQYHPLFIPRYSVTNVDACADRIVSNARARQSFGVTALATHGLVECIGDPTLRSNINKLDVILPDGQAVAWALKLFYGKRATRRIAGMDITQAVLDRANREKLSVFLYGSTENTLNGLQAYIARHYPNVLIAGRHVDRFREATEEEDREDIDKIRNSGAHLVFVGRGCPRQEKWVINHLGKIDAPMLAIGAVFDFMAGNIKRAPVWMQRSGLEWLHRLAQEPGRLWKRNLTTNTYFVYLVFSRLLTRKGPVL